MGLITSSPDWAMISYPSKAMKVSPMATTIPSTPLGMKSSVNRLCQWGVRSMAIRPKKTKRSRMASLVIVTTLPMEPVSEAPR